jgi:sRNA-binding regulator protein Hfq
MKEIMDPMPAGEATDNFANRKLIRPTLARTENHGNQAPGNHAPGNHGPAPVQVQMGDRRERMERTERTERIDRHDRGDRGERSMGLGGGGGKKPAPPEQTNAESFYYQKQMQTRTPMVIVLRDGEEVHGVIEWYDRNCIKVNRDSGGPNLMIYKPAIKYMYKEGENQR